MPRRLSPVLGTLFTFAGLAAAALVVLVLLAWWGQERVVFQPPAGAGSTPVAGATRLTLVADDGTPTFAYLVGDAASARTPDGLVIHFHGNAEIAEWAIDWGQEVARRTGAAVLLAEYRGYAGVPGAPTYAASVHDARALWRMAQAELGATPARTTIHGFSLGSAIATELALEVVPKALVLEAPFTSAEAMAGRAGPWLRGPLWRLIARVHYDTRGKVAMLDVPVWVAHGERDVVIPTSMGREVFAAARMPAKLLLVPRAGHNDLRGGAGYWEWLQAAIGRNGIS